MKDPLDQPQGVHSRQHQSQRGDDCRRPTHLVGPEQDEELGNEVAQAGKAQCSHGKDRPEATQCGELGPEPSHATEVPRTQPFFEHAGHQEQTARAERVTHDLQDHPLQGELVPGEHAQKDEAHVADARVGDHPLEIRLGERHDGAVEDACDTQAHRYVAKVEGRLGKQRDQEAQHPVGSHLDQEAGEHHAAGGVRLRMGVREPPVQRYGGQLHGEGGKETQHDQQPGGPGERCAEQSQVVEGVVPRLPSVHEVQGHD